MDADFLVSLKRFQSLFAEDGGTPTPTILRQFDRYIASVERSISVVPRLQKNDFGNNYDSTLRAVYNELTLRFSELSQLERAFKREKEEALLDLFNGASLEQIPTDDNERYNTLASFYGGEQERLATIFQRKIVETLIKYFPEQMLGPNSLALIRKTLPEHNRWRRRIESQLQIFEQGNSNSMSHKEGYTHRERALAHLFKVEVGAERRLSRKEQTPKKFEQAFDSLNPRTKSVSNPYRPATLTELQHVIELLAGYPTAQAIAEKKLRETPNPM
jgi:hypothetical protein